MTTTTERARTWVRPKVIEPTIREVCLIGSPGREYAHLTPEGLKAEGSGRKSKRAIPDQA